MATSEQHSYHHGDLKRALLDAAEAVLTDRGATGFTLRECARRAGVSSAAPAHHFGNITGLLTAIAARGFIGLGDAMSASADTAGSSQPDRLTAIGEAYLDYARQHPARYRVMFGQMELDRNEPAFRAAGDRAFAVLSDTVRAVAGPEDPQLKAKTIAAWSIVHGYAMLIADRRLPLDDHEAEMLGRSMLRFFSGAVRAA